MVQQSRVQQGKNFLRGKFVLYPFRISPIWFYWNSRTSDLEAFCSAARP